MPHIDYKVNGEVFPSATELTSLLPKDWLFRWYKGAVQKDGWNGWLKCNAVSEIGKKLGTAVHGHLEALAKREEDKTESYENSLAIAQSLYNTVNPTVEEYVAIEPHLVSNELKIHGTADIIYRKVYTSGLRIGDYKTAKERDLSHPIQLACYALCWNESNPDQLIDAGDIFRVDKKSKNLKITVDEYINLSQYYPLIKALRLLWQYTRGS